MRLDIDYSLNPNVCDFDVLLVDSVGTTFNTFSIANGGLGGSEQQAILLLEGLSAAGYSVGCINRGPHASRSLNGVRYFPVNDIERGTVAPRCKTLISMRAGFMPNGIEFDTVVFWLHDIPDKNLQNISTYLRDMDDSRIVTVSDWQKSKLPPGWDTRATTIYNQIPDWIYDVKSEQRRNFTYASAALKGLDATLAAWAQLKKKSYFFKDETLFVLSPGYDKPSSDITTNKGVIWVGPRPLTSVVNYIGGARALFYVNSGIPETFGLVPLMAEVLGTPTLIYCPGETGALTELMHVKPCTTADEFLERCEAKSYMGSTGAHDNLRSSNIIPQWEKYLGLKQ